MDWAPFFSRIGAVGVDLDVGTIEPHGLNPDPNPLLPLERLEPVVQDAVLRPSVPPHVDGVPRAESLRQATPFVAVFGHVENGVEYL